MTPSTSATSPQRLLVPVSGKIRDDGAAFVPLSPHKGMHNAAIIYQAINHMPDRTLVRGDFDKQSRPLIYFPERPPKKIGSLSPFRESAGMQRHGQRGSIAELNAACDRREFSNFLTSIAEAAYQVAPSGSKLMTAAIHLKNLNSRIREEQRDYSVADIRGPLRVIARAYALRNLKDPASPYVRRRETDPRLQAARFECFVGMGKDMQQKLHRLMKEAGCEGKVAPLVSGMSNLLDEFLSWSRSGDISFSTYLRKSGIGAEAYGFALFWLRLGTEEHSVIRKQLDIEGWARELDAICPKIVDEYRIALKREFRMGAAQTAQDIGASPAKLRKAFAIDALAVPPTPPEAVALPTSAAGSGTLEEAEVRTTPVVTSATQAAPETASIPNPVPETLSRLAPASMTNTVVNPEPRGIRRSESSRSITGASRSPRKLMRRYTRVNTPRSPFFIDPARRSLHSPPSARARTAPGTPSVTLQVSDDRPVPRQIYSAPHAPGGTAQPAPTSPEPGRNSL